MVSDDGLRDDPEVDSGLVAPIALDPGAVLLGGPFSVAEVKHVSSVVVSNQLADSCCGSTAGPDVEDGGEHLDRSCLGLHDSMVAWDPALHGCFAHVGWGWAGVANHDFPVDDVLQLMSL